MKHRTPSPTAPVKPETEFPFRLRRPTAMRTVFASSPLRLLLVGLALGCGWLSPARGQIVVSMEPTKKLYVAYEPIQMEISILNRAGRDVVLTGKGATPWLSFQITDQNGHLISPRSNTDFPPVMVPAGQMLSRKIAVNHLYPMNSRGMYRIQASVYFPQLDRYFNSRPETIQVSEARELWHQVVGVPDDHEMAGSYRRYVLLTFNNGSQKLLYVRVQDEKSGVVRTSYSIGQVILIRKPKWAIDKENRLHVLHMGAPRTFAHTIVNVDGKMVEREIYYEEGSSRPKLQPMPDGSVSVVGGISDKEAKRDPLQADVRKISERPKGLPTPGAGSGAR